VLEKGLRGSKDGNTSKALTSSQATTEPVALVSREVNAVRNMSSRRIVKLESESERSQIGTPLTLKN